MTTPVPSNHLTRDRLRDGWGLEFLSWVLNSNRRRMMCRRFDGRRSLRRPSGTSLLRSNLLTKKFLGTDRLDVPFFELLWVEHFHQPLPNLVTLGGNLSDHVHSGGIRIRSTIIRKLGSRFG